MRCFLAIDLSQEIKAELKHVLEEVKALEIDASFVKPEQMHLTLAFFGETSEEEAGRKIKALESLSFPPFSLSVAGTGFFPNDKFIRVFYTRVESPCLAELQKKVVSLLLHKEDHPFTGHVTLARVKTPRNLDALRELQKKLCEKKFGEMLAKEIVFKKSTLSPKGPAYEDIAKIPLK